MESRGIGVAGVDEVVLPSESSLTKAMASSSISSQFLGMPALAYQVEKFEGVKCDFPLWQMRMRDFLMIHGWVKLWKVVLSKTCANYQKILADLENIEVKIEEEDKAMILCCSLPSSLEHFVDTLLYGKTTITLSEVVNAMLSKDERMKATVVEESEQGLVARGCNMDRTSSNKKWRSKSRGKSKGSIVCFGCKQTGHIKKECPNRKGKYEKREGTFRGHNGDDNSSGEMLVVTSSEDDSSRWVMDSGCTFHMCPRLDWFSTLDEIQGGKVLMGNDGECEVKGIGNIRLRTHDKPMHTLTNVRYVPEITKNLISLGALDARGYRISITGGFMRVLKESLVIMKAEKRRNLYFMLGEVVAGSANVSSSVVAGKEDSAMLWHMRLGHMGERRMTALGRQGMLGDTQLGNLPFCVGVHLAVEGSSLLILQEVEKSYRKPV
ncbi:hypothetical protein MLD38_028565 [Melastoma candidum]|uniref:Uncharacterized protein n=1 Tax=Melastoma candidum TaxID=119954 RepID=A0ACB9N162_9MYRT|nr:hypothetical protein MLD38_028565 [Melastoma candidum]